MNNIILAVVFITTLLSCAPKKESVNATNSDSTIAQSQSPSASENSPGAALEKEGWVNLFDGTSMDGWVNYKNGNGQSWKVQDQTLHCLPFDSTEQRGDLRTSGKYKDFELTFDWKLAPAANSGVMFRVTEDLNEPFFSGPEYQIIDDNGYPGDLEDWQRTGSAYAMYAPPKTKKVNPVGSWNTSKIVVKGNHVEHWLNGEKLFEYEINSPEWKKLKESGKWKDEARYGQEPEGYIVLQDHKNEAWFKNIFIKPL